MIKFEDVLSVSRQIEFHCDGKLQEVKYDVELDIFYGVYILPDHNDSVVIPISGVNKPIDEYLAYFKPQ